jgi:multidrug efflux pump subunit AcrA (membrane-fusion protein)
MSTAVDEELADLLPDHLSAPEPKGKAVALVRTPSQQARLAKKQAERAAEADLAQAQSAAQATAARLAQIVNLHIAGYSLAQIGASIGASADEVDRLLQNDAARYIRNQPALRTYIRNWVSERYMKMIEADYPMATDPTHRDKLENQDRVMRMLDRMAKLHGAEAPTQTEVKVEAAPEAVEKLVNALAAGQGLGYNMDIFDVPESDIHEAVEQTHDAVVVSGNAVEQPQEGDPGEGF